jgi:hypothetical protein
MLATLLARNTELFTTRYYEAADFGANSILIEQARRFTLLVGNYSRVGFHHPGPAYMYVQAGGESLFYDALHVVPTPWNGQLLAVYVLNSALLAMAVAVVYGWCGGMGRRIGLAGAATGLAPGLAVFAAFAALHPQALSSDWMPNEYITPFLVFCIAAASVAAGRGRDAWIMTLAGWFLIHGHVCFLFFVPVITVVVLILAGWPYRRRMREALREMGRARYAWMPVVVISLVFALPIALNVILHWPGDFGSYLTYSGSSKAGGHSVSDTVHFTLWFWGAGAAWLIIAGLSLAALAAALLIPGPVRRYLISLLVVAAVATAAFVYYVATGVDDLSRPYVGYFYWAVPMVLVLVIVIAVAAAVPGRVTTAVTGVAAVAAVAGFAVVPGTMTSTQHVDPEFPIGIPAATDPGLASAVRTVAARADGKTVVVYLYHAAWPTMTGFLVEAERTGVRACVASPWWKFMVTAQFICTPGQIADGAGFLFHPAGAQVPGTIATLRTAVITPYLPSR